MQELFIKYPLDSIIRYKGISYRVLGYEMHDGKFFLICEDGKDGIRIRVK